MPCPMLRPAYVGQGDNMRRLIFAALSIMTAACAGAQEKTVHADLLITGATLIHPDDKSKDGIGDIAVRDGIIIALGANLTETVSSDLTHDAGGRFIIPGLADMHSHFGNAILPPGEDDTAHVLARHLYFGNTTILNLGSYQAWPTRIDQLRADIAAGALSGPRLLAVGSLMTMTGSHPTTTIYSPDVQQQIKDILKRIRTDGPIDLAPLRATTLVNTPDHVRAEVKRVGDWGADAIKLTVESGPLEFGDDHPQMTPAMIAAAVETAAPYGAPVLCHISSLDELEACLANGATGIVHGLTSSPDEDIPADLERRMVDAKFIVIPTGAMFDGWTRYTDDISLLDQPALSGVLSESEKATFSSPQMVQAFKGDAAWAESIQRLRNHLKTFHDLGGMIVAGTDTGNPYRFAGLALHEEIAFYVSAGLTPREALATSTINAAKLVSEDNQWGSIEVGLAADFVVLEKNPLEDISHTLSIVDVIKAGELVNRADLPLH